MKTRTIIALILTLLVMVLVPVLTVFTVMSTDTLGLMFLYTMVLNPIVSIAIGILAGWGDKLQWYLPAANAVVYLIASAVIMGFDVSWLIGAAVYLVLGIAAAYVTGSVKKHKAAR